MQRRVAIIGGGVAGVTAAWQLARTGCEYVLFEASGRLGGTVETLRRDGFVIDLGPDGWITEKPWAGELATELGLGGDLIGSNDPERVTYVLRDGQLVPMPDGMRMMVPADLALLEGSALFSDTARQAYAAEPGRAAALRAHALSPESDPDESVASFVLRHFGEEVLVRVAAPLLSGVFGGDVARLSVRAVMPQFVAMEREYGSLILGLRARMRATAAGTIFTSLRGGTGALVDAMAGELPGDRLRLCSEVTQLAQVGTQWRVECGGDCDRRAEVFDAVMLAVPAQVASRLLGPLNARMAELTRMEASSAVIVALAFDEALSLPQGFGFLVPAGEANLLLAGTFVDQKYPGRSPAGKAMLRAFFGGTGAGRVKRMPDTEVAALALDELRKVLGALPEPGFAVVRRWPLSLPQYGVGHLERMAELDSLRRSFAGLWLLGNAYRGVGLPDLVRDARAAAREFAAL